MSDGADESDAYTVTVDVTGVNDPASASGTPTIAGTAEFGQVLAADISGITDIDGLHASRPAEHRWIRVDGSDETDIDGATGSTYTLTAADVGKKIKVRVRVFDTFEDSTDLTSAAVTVADNAAPTGADKTVTTAEDTAYSFAAADFGFGDSDTGDVLAGVRIVTLPELNGESLTLDGAAVSAGETVSAADIGAGKLEYTPPANRYGDGVASFTFRVSDGIFESVAPNTITIDVTAVNDPAVGAPVVVAPNLFRVPATLRADTSSISDVEGVTPSAFGYRWTRVDADGISNPVQIDLDASTYTLTAADAGKRIRVQLTFRDNEGNVEIVPGAAWPATGTILAAASCEAPELAGGATFIGSARTLSVGRETIGGTDWHGFSASVGSLGGGGFSIADNDFTIGHARVSENGALSVSLDADLGALERETLALHVCGSAFAFADASGPDSAHSYIWASSGLDWSGQAQRTLYLSGDGTAPAVSSATAAGTSLTLTFDEPLGAAASLANAAFSVVRTPAGGDEETAALSVAHPPVIEGATVTLTLASAIVSTDTGIEVSYRKPESGSNNRLADRIGNEVAGFAGQAVINATGSAPTATDGTVTATEDTAYAFAAGDFGFADADPGDALASVRIVTLPAAGKGSLTLDGVAVSANDAVSAADIGSSKLTYVPPADAHGEGFASFTFRVSDGIFESTAANTITIDVDASADPTSNTLQTAATCSAPTYSGGATGIWQGELTLGTLELNGRASGYGFASVAGHEETGGLDDRTFEVGSSEYTIDAVVRTLPGSGAYGNRLLFSLTGAIANAHRNQLALHVCDKAYLLGHAADSSSPLHNLTWSTEEDWSGHATRTLRLSRDAVAPTLVSATVDRASLTLAFDEPLVDEWPRDPNFAPAVVGNAFTVTRAPSSGEPENVRVTGAARIDGSAMTLTLRRKVRPGETVTVSYEAPDTGDRLSDPFGNAVADFSGRSVTNSTVNVAPRAADGTVTTAEDTAHAFSVKDFGFSDSDAGDALESVRFVTVPESGRGSLSLGNRRIEADDEVSAADIDAGRLTYAPPADEYGTGYASFTFRVSDGMAQSAAAYTMTVDVTAVNDPASGAPAIAGIAAVGQMLSVSTAGIADMDGMTKAAAGDAGHAYTYQWVRMDGGTETAISGAQSATYTPAVADQGKMVKVRVSFADDAGNAEGPLASEAYPKDGTVGSCATPDFASADRRSIWTGALSVRPYVQASPPMTVGYGFYRGTGSSGLAGSLSPERFTVGSNEYGIGDVFLFTGEGPLFKPFYGYDAGQLLFSLDEELSAAEREALVLHVCGTQFALSDAGYKGAGTNVHDYAWTAADLDWSAVSERTLHLSVPQPETSAQVTVSVADAEAAEGATLGFVVTLSEAASTAVTVAYATADGTASAGEDYTTASGTLTFEAGTTERTVEVPVTDDETAEAAETVRLVLSDARGAELGDGEAVGTIAASDGFAGFTASFVSVPPEHDGSNAFAVELRFSEEPHELSYVTVRNALFIVGGGDAEQSAAPRAALEPALRAHARSRRQRGGDTRAREHACLRQGGGRVHRGQSVARWDAFPLGARPGGAFGRRYRGGRGPRGEARLLRLARPGAPRGGNGRVRDGRRHRHCGGGLHRDERDLDLRARRDGEDRRGAGLARRP